MPSIILIPQQFGAFCHSLLELPVDELLQEGLEVDDELFFIPHSSVNQLLLHISLQKLPHHLLIDVLLGLFDLNWFELSHDVLKPVLVNLRRCL